MIIPHLAFKPPFKKQHLWRYFTLERFIWLIEKNQLYFASVTLLREMDPYEGYWSKYDFKKRFPDSDWDEAWKLGHDWSRFTFVNCWHANTHQSIAMWRLYGESVAIQTSYERLGTAFTQDDVYAGMVRYIDYEKELIHRLNRRSEYALFMTKDQSYDHEKEFRLVLPEYPPREEINAGANVEQYPYLGKGVSITVDLSVLLEAIYVSPKLQDEHVEVVSKILKKYGYENIPIIRSHLGQPPGIS